MLDETRPDDVVFATLTSCGIAGTKGAWPFKKEPPLPWFVYRHKKKGEVYADDRNYAKMQEALGVLGPYACYESWTPMENCWVTAYTLTYHPNN